MLIFWLVVGLLLSGLELIVPGAVLVFVGLGALTSSALIYFGYVDTWVSAFVCWFLSSIVYLFTLRTLAMKMFPGESSKQNTDEEMEAAGTIVVVTEDISSIKPGRISYLDSSWVAYGSSNIIKGQKAVLVSQQKNGWDVKELT